MSSVWDKFKQPILPSLLANSKLLDPDEVCMGCTLDVYILGTAIHRVETELTPLGWLEEARRLGWFEVDMFMIPYHAILRIQITEIRTKKK